MKIDRSPPGAGRLGFTTPVMRKFRCGNLTPETSPTSSKPTATESKSLVAELQSLRRIVSDSEYRIYDAIFSWLHGFLTSTEPVSQTAHPKSLLGMCLRRIPDAIAVIEEWDRQTAAKAGKTFKWQSSKASAELYDQLEEFGTSSMGWKPLKIVVRAHALCLLATAVTEGLLEPPFVRLLADLCLSLDCKTEAARLVSSLRLPLVAPRGTSSTLIESSTVQPLGVIVKSLQGRGTIGPSWDCLSNLINTKKLSLTWLTSRAFQSVWMRGIEILLHSKKPVPSVVEFLCKALDQLLLDSDKAKETEQPTEDQTLTRVLAAMTAAIWTLGVDMSDEEPWKAHAIRRLIFTLEIPILGHEFDRRESGQFISEESGDLRMRETVDSKKRFPNSVGSDKDAGNHDDTDDREDKNDTRATSITDIDEEQDSGDELGECAQMMDYSPRKTLGRTHGINGSGRSSSGNIKTLKRVKRLDIARTWQEKRPDRVAVGTSLTEPGEDDMDDELSTL
ncbi:unnamed protein product [Fusarium fujikuroi]|nr:unnamed protein product [Fusarium fujikuroi]